MTKLEQELAAQIQERLLAVDLRAGQELKQMKPALQKLLAAYAALGTAAQKTLEGLLPELAALLAAAEEIAR